MSYWIESEKLNKKFYSSDLFNFKKGQSLFKKECYHVINDVSFKLRSHCVTGFVGANGSGKTTLIKLILGFIKKTDGVLNYPLDQNQLLNFKTKIGFLPERPYYYDFLTPYELLKYFWNMQEPNLQEPNLQFNEIFYRVMKQVRLSEKHFHSKIKVFSKGMLQRVGMALALIHNPEYLILDEPMSGLDPEGRYLVKKIIQELKASGKSILFTSHLIEDVEELCEDILFIDNGKMIYSGPLETLKSSYHNESLMSVLNAISARHLGESQ